MHHRAPTFAALFAGMLYLGSPLPASAKPTVSIASPVPGAVVGDLVQVQVKIWSVDQILAVKAQTAFGSADLHYAETNGALIWEGAVPLKGAAWGNQNISFTVTYAGNQQVTAQVTVLHDLPPTVTLGASIDGIVTAGDLPVDATCVDDAPMPCTIELLYRGQTVASGPSPFKKTISLASLAPSSFLDAQTRAFSVSAKDSSGQLVGIPAAVWVMPARPGRVEVERVAGGEIEDFNEGWLVTRDMAPHTGQLSKRHLYDRAAKQDVLTTYADKVYLTPSGALFNGSVTTMSPDPNPGIGGLHQWKNGTITSFGRGPFTTLLVRGNYAAWDEYSGTDPKALTCKVFERDLLTDAMHVVGGGGIAGDPWDITQCSYYPGIPLLALAEDGDLYFTRNNVFSGNQYDSIYRYVIATDTIKSYTLHDRYSSVISVSAQLFAHRYQALSVIDLDLVDESRGIGTTYTFMGGLHQFSVNKDWFAYERNDGGVVQVWRRYPEAQEEQVSLFPDDSHLVSIGSDGQVVFSHGTALWVGLPGAAPVPGAPYKFINGQAYVAIGRSLFLDTDLSVGSSSTSASAGVGGSGTGGAGSASGAGGASVGSVSSAGGANAGGANAGGGASSGAETSATSTSMSAGSSGSGNLQGGHSSGGCTMSGARDGRGGLTGLTLLGLAALAARRRARRLA